MTTPKFTSALIFFLLFMPLSLAAKPSLQTVNFTAKELKELAGHYSTIMGYVHINVRKNIVSTNIDGKYIRLIKKSDNHIYPSYKFLRIIPISLGDMSFTLNNNKGNIQLSMHQPKKKGKRQKVKVVAQKFKPSSVPQVWKKRVGIYKAKRIKGTSNIKKIKLAMQHGVLVAFINKIKRPYPLLALSESSLYSPSAGHNSKQSIKISSIANQLSLQYGKNSLILQKL